MQLKIFIAAFAVKILLQLQFDNVTAVAVVNITAVSAVNVTAIEFNSYAKVMLQLQLSMLLHLHLSMKLQYAVINDAAITNVNIAEVAVVIELQL